MARMRVPRSARLSGARASRRLTAHDARASGAPPAVKNESSSAGMDQLGAAFVSRMKPMCRSGRPGTKGGKDEDRISAPQMDGVLYFCLASQVPPDTICALSRQPSNRVASVGARVVSLTQMLVAHEQRGVVLLTAETGTFIAAIQHILAWWAVRSESHVR
eukprot:scaffold53008_cov32-Tisochrysis_lutea.AAC.3